MKILIVLLLLYFIPLVCCLIIFKLRKTKVDDFDIAMSLVPMFNIVDAIKNFAGLLIDYIPFPHYYDILDGIERWVNKGKDD